MNTRDRLAFGFYVISFTVWGSLLFFLQPVVSVQVVGATFWMMKVQQTLTGAAIGAASAGVGLLLGYVTNRFPEAAGEGVATSELSTTKRTQHEAGR
jgi:hypothetical protein